MDQPTDNSVFENILDDKLELQSQLRTGNVTALDLASSSLPDNFSPGWRFYASFTSLCIITLAVALDATSLSVALPVTAPPFHQPLTMVPDRRGTFKTYRMVWKGMKPN